MVTKFWNVLRKQRGATAIEYALIAGLIAVALIGALGLFGDKLEAFFTYIGTQLPTGGG